MLKLSSSAKSDSKLNTRDRHIRKKEKNHSRKPNYDLKFERKFQAKDHRRKFPRRTPNRQTPLSDPVSKQEQMDRMLRLSK